MANIPSISEKSTGAIVASAIGDALGWPNELRASSTTKNKRASDQFQEWTRRSGGQYWPHSEKILAGEYSDDTQMILSVARSIITGSWELTFTKKELPYWLNYERGGGSALKNAAKLHKKGIVPWESNESRSYFTAGGNGAAMRILPHVIAMAQKQDIDAIVSEVIKNSLYTHGHPRAILGATCYAFALHYLMKKDTVLEYGGLIKAVTDGAKYWSTLNQNALPAGWLDLAEKHSGFDYHRVWAETATNMIEKLGFITESLHKGLLVNDNTVLKHLECFDQANGAGDVAILSSLYLASKYANNPALGIKTAAYSIGADTDTIASMTGGLLGMLCGSSWIPLEWKLLQDYDCLYNIAEILLANNMIEASKHIAVQSKSQYNDWMDSPVGKIRLLTTSVLPSGKTGKVVIDKMVTLLGQTLYIKKYERKGKTDQDSAKPFVQEEKPVQLEIDHVMAMQATFTLDSNGIKDLMNNPLLARITFKKVLQVIEMFINNIHDINIVADKLGVDKDVVEIIKQHVR
jgi:ADP-ribosylglycohydrolase